MARRRCFFTDPRPPCGWSRRSGSTSWPVPTAAGFGHPDLSDCRFDGTTYEGNIHGRFTRCGFTLARFLPAGFAGGADVRACDFTGARFKGFEGHAGSYEGCAFHSASITACTLVRCSFRGATFEAGLVGACELIDLQSNLIRLEDPPREPRSFTFPHADQTTGLGGPMRTGTKMIAAVVRN